MAGRIPEATPITKTSPAKPQLQPEPLVSVLKQFSFTTPDWNKIFGKKSIPHKEKN